MEIVSPPGRCLAAGGVAGGSARQEYQRRHDRREERIDQKWGASQRWSNSFPTTGNRG
ncbi:MAG: hypothetical protein M3083_15155 [Actinomycetota bacterium]|nr:hypothetical protein [Actinomycetota bacterium]MDQ6947359.1 hypothetical protein [Actinomycetota bacterium]